MAYRVFWLSLAGSVLPAALVMAEMRTLTWDDKSQVEVGFVIERREGTAGAWQVVGHVEANVEEFVDAGLLPGKTYFWRVRAYNSAGMSGPSNEVSATLGGTAPQTALPAAPDTAAVK